MLKQFVAWILGAGGITFGIYLVKDGCVTLGCLAAYFGGVLQLSVLEFLTSEV